MKRKLKPQQKKNIWLTLLLASFLSFAFAQQSSTTNKFEETKKIIGAQKINPTTVELIFSTGQRLTLDFYGDNIFRLFQDNDGGFIRGPLAKPEAKILVENARQPVATLNVSDENNQVTITTNKISFLIDKNTSLFKIINRLTKSIVVEQAAPIQFEKEKTTLSLKENPQEYFYGGGVQNGRFSHKGKTIAIENQNSWTDGGVASPAPYYWSTNGYAVMWYTFSKGNYNFGAKEKGLVKLMHETNYADVFFMISDGASALLNDYYQLTGNPVLLPKFGFYEGHLNAYNRDFWKEDNNGILFEDGKRYKESQKDNGGIKESLNGEKNNYQFSARAVIDRYKKHDMPLGWILPNDGYGAGYGQTETLDGNINNLKSLGDYARKNGVEIGLWTQSDLHPKPEISALLQRDLIKEARDAGVRVLKTDVAWVGAGYSFGLHGIADAAQIISYYGNNSRPFIISLDGWAGTQRYAAIWSGDQTGGAWEYIRFHIPTYIGSGLSGLPNITSDMDGIFGGKNITINTRDFQWKAFTPMQLNMDGWGANEKYPHALGEPAVSINRFYLKLKSQLIPYTYSIAREAVTGLPIMRAMFLQYPNNYTKGTSTQYQYTYGPNFLVAPIYQATKLDDKGNDIRNGIYLPEGTWIDYFSGNTYTGNRILNSFDAPLWKLPLFVKNGAIIPETNANNNISEINKNTRMYEFYPFGKSSFTEYDDDGKTEAYKLGKGVNTLINSELNGANATIIIHATKGSFDGFVKEKSTSLIINVTDKPKAITATIGKNNIELAAANSMDDFEKKAAGYFYNAAPNLNKFATSGSDFEKTAIIKNPQLLIKLPLTDITANEIVVSVKGYKFNVTDKNLVLSGQLNTPPNSIISNSNATAYTLTPSWSKVKNADFYEIEFNDMLYSTIKDTSLLFDGLHPETAYSFKLRAVNKSGYSVWTTINGITKPNPLQFAIQEITATITTEDEEGSEVDKLFDFDENSMWHTKYGAKSIPLDIVMDLRKINQLDKLQYLPRISGKNGMLLQGKIYYSSNKQTWTEAGAFEWKNTNDVKTFDFPGHPTARYIKIEVKDGVGGFGSGRELYIFKVPGTESYLPGDINNDHLIDKNDLTSYINYTGLKKGDADFEGYISNGDINKNNLIDAYDISVAATQLDGGVINTKNDKTVTGKIEISTAKTSYDKDEVIEVTVKGIDLAAVNALSFALPYNPQDYEFAGVQNINTKQMENFTNDRLHTNGNKVLYPTFVNVGNKETLTGNVDLFVLKFKAKRKLQFNLTIENGVLVDKQLNTAGF